MSKTKSTLPIVLVIDDDRSIHLLAKRHLSAEGFKLISAENGCEGIESFNTYSPEIVLVDMDMPELDGFATCTAIRELPKGKNTPLLMVIETEDAEKIALSYSVGATDFVVKPINWKVLIHRLNYMIKASKVLHQLKKSAARLTKAQQMARLGYWEWNIVEDKLYWSDEIYEMFERKKEFFVPDHQSFLNMIHEMDRLYVEEGFDKAIKNKAEISIEYRIVSEMGQQRFVEQQIEIIENQYNQLVGLTGTIQDITERRQIENQVKHLAYYDLVTGLPNRTHFLELLSRALELAKRNQRNFAVLFLDMDGFKGINDTYGHHVGDLLLKEFSKRLTDGLRRSDIASRFLDNHNYSADIARLGGDEFTILLNELTEPKDAGIVAKNIQQWISEPFYLHNQLVYSGASIGISIFPQDGKDSETLLKNADIAMYHAKKLGKGNYQFFVDSMTIKAKKRLEMDSYMLHAVENDELHLFYQPIFNVNSGQLIGTEALLRWENPQLGFLLPEDFIPLAEENGMIVKLGEWVMREVCRQHKKWQQQGMGYLTIAINVSSLQFNHASFVSMIKEVLFEYQIDPVCFTIELTESIILENTGKTLDTLNQLKALGFKLSIDDFGTGYSSLSYLKHFPLDSLKIDKSFVKNLPSNLDDAAIVNAILALAGILNLFTIAEGVETEQQREFFQSNACQAIQGYLFSKPMPIDEFNQYWQAQSHIQI